MGLEGDDLARVHEPPPSGPHGGNLEALPAAVAQNGAALQCGTNLRAVFRRADASPSFEASAAASAHLHVRGETLSNDYDPACFTRGSKLGLDSHKPESTSHAKVVLAPPRGCAPRQLADVPGHMFVHLLMHSM